MGDSLIDLLPGGKNAEGAKKLADWVAKNEAMVPAAARIETDKVQLLLPIPRPNKLLLLAGNYNSHIQEGGGIPTERKETFPYVFMIACKAAIKAGDRLSAEEIAALIARRELCHDAHHCPHEIGRASCRERV